MKIEISVKEDPSGNHTAQTSSLGNGNAGITYTATTKENAFRLASDEVRKELGPDVEIVEVDSHSPRKEAAPDVQIVEVDSHKK